MSHQEKTALAIDGIAQAAMKFIVVQSRLKQLKGAA